MIFQFYFQTIIALSALFAAALAIPAGPPAYADVPPVYSYEYAVADEYSGANFGQNEHRDGYVTSGEYRVHLPDGRLQIVTYHVDGDSGYIADVKYTGEPKYGPSPKAPHA